MSAKAVFLRSAERDLKELRAYVKGNFGADTWQATAREIKQAVRQIETYPDSGSIPNELESLNLQQYRQIVTGMNRLIYEVRGSSVFIHVVCDTRRDFKSLLFRRLVR